MVKLKDYQLDALSRMHNGCILCGGVGSGKSITSLGYFYILQGGSVEPFMMPYKMINDLVIITTAHKRDTMEWEDELIHYGLHEGYNDQFDIYVIIDSWNNIQKYKDMKNCFFIFDEQRVVGNGVWVKSFLLIAKSNQWILLSATPGDTWSDYAPVFIANGFFHNVTEFRRNHCVYSRYTKYPKIERYLDICRLMRLKERVLVTMDFNRETVSHHVNVVVPYDICKYKKIMKERFNYEKNEPMRNASELCTALRKICNLNDAKLNEVLDILEEHPKAILFYNFDYELEMMKNLFEAIKYPYAEWNGHKHQNIPETDNWVYLVQYAAGNEGWNCTKTDTMIFLSNNYSYKVMVQAAGRIDRMNTPFTDLYYYHLKTRSSIDASIDRALRDKKKFNEVKFAKMMPNSRKNSVL